MVRAADRAAAVQERQRWRGDRAPCVLGRMTPVDDRGCDAWPARCELRRPCTGPARPRAAARACRGLGSAVGCGSDARHRMARSACLLWARPVGVQPAYRGRLPARSRRVPGATKVGCRRGRCQFSTRDGSAADNAGAEPGRMHDSAVGEGRAALGRVPGSAAGTVAASSSVRARVGCQSGRAESRRVSRLAAGKLARMPTRVRSGLGWWWLGRLRGRVVGR
jgi:hypothetical protein